MQHYLKDKIWINLKHNTTQNTTEQSKQWFLGLSLTTLQMQMLQYLWKKLVSGPSLLVLASWGVETPTGCRCGLLSLPCRSVGGESELSERCKTSSFSNVTTALDSDVTMKSRKSSLLTDSVAENSVLKLDTLHTEISSLRFNVPLPAALEIPLAL